jgi:factor associated with neutral sphingomyelinase activation
VQVNKQGVDFGCRSGGQPVGDVALPPWASDASDFLYKLQEALESPHVSARLHKWIDLVFGRKARGTLAEKADNVFHYLTYDEVALRFLHQEGDPLMREALRLQMMEFGRTPRQVGVRPRCRQAGRQAKRTIVPAVTGCLGGAAR